MVQVMEYSLAPEVVVVSGEMVALLLGAVGGLELGRVAALDLGMVAGLEFGKIAGLEHRGIDWDMGDVYAIILGHATCMRHGDVHYMHAIYILQYPSNSVYAMCVRCIWNIIYMRFSATSVGHILYMRYICDVLPGIPYKRISTSVAYISSTCDVGI